MIRGAGTGAGAGTARRRAYVLLGFAIVIIGFVVYAAASANRGSSRSGVTAVRTAAASTAGATAAAASAAAATASTGSPPVQAESPAASTPASGSTSAPSAGSPVTAAPSPPGALAAVDPSLLKVLPSTIAGVPVTEFAAAAREAATDPDLGRNVSRVATAFAGDPAGTNWAYTAIVDVRPEAQSDAFYRDWQESFDQSACERAGGVTGHTTVVIAGHDVERTACGQGVRTYHVRIAGTGLLVSISSLGEGKFGELEIAALP